jgi:hypothetical protein
MSRSNALVLAPIALLSSLVLGCGSSAEPTRASGPAVVPVTSATPVAPPRALRDAPLTATSPSNVLLDPTFLPSSGGGPTWGHWLAVDHSGNLATFATSTLGANPLGVASPVVSFPAKPVGTTGGKALDFLAPFPGGTGASTASLWVSRNDAAGLPTTLDAASKSISISVLGLAGVDTNEGVDLVRDESATTVIAGRTWYRYRANIAAGLELAGFFEISIDKSPGSYLLTGPELLPKSLATLPQPMARTFAVAPRALRPSELGAIAAYHRLAPPLHLSAQALRKRMPRPE